jgi:acetolactate synthase-1/2/3 large subunit
MKHALVRESAYPSEASAEVTRARTSAILPIAHPVPEGRPATCTASEALVEVLCGLGVKYAFGLFGGAIAPFCKALSQSSIELLHFRHEAGAAFAAIEASLASGAPVVVFGTTGPGVTNMITGMVAARWEGAKVIFVSGSTPARQRGRWAFQEMSDHTGTIPGFGAGPVFHYAASIEDVAEIDVAASRLATGVARPSGFVAHLALALPMQTARVAAAPRKRLSSLPAQSCDASLITTCVELLTESPFAIWTGFGARDAATQVRALAERADAPVMSSPRGKGVMPEDHPLYLGVTGLGGHASVEAHMRAHRPSRVLVLGSRLGELTSFWSDELVPRDGFVHVDVDSEVFGAAYPRVETLGVTADIGTFLDALLEAWPEETTDSPFSPSLVEARPAPRRDAPRNGGPVRPSFLMSGIQKIVVERSDAVVMTEAGNAFVLGTHHLRFNDPHRYRVSTGFGSMGHVAAGVIGAALHRRGKAVAIVGDGTMLMLNEINTAVTYDASAVWVVLNDAQYGMISQGMQSIGWKPFETDFVRTDFVAIARAMGADGVRVECECDVEAALRAAMEAAGPFVVDVVVDPSERAPSGRRNESLQRQGIDDSGARGRS